MKLNDKTPSKDDITEILQNSTIELHLCPGERSCDANGLEYGEPSKVFLFWNSSETFKEFPSSMKLIDLIFYMNEEDKKAWIWEGEYSIKTALRRLERKRNELLQ